jgi:predicted acylesterase/phospholipase RssA
MTKLHFSLVLFALALLLSACASRPSSDLLALNQKPWGTVQTASTNDTSPANTVQSPKTLLALSGGGANGAFGAGVLHGWLNTGRRPDFDVVSGVSAGALQAVIVFAGEEYDGELRRNFTNIRLRDIAKPLVPFGVLNDGLADNQPLRDRIENVITHRMLASIARQHGSGRRLFVTTTNLDAGAPVTWDMGEIAASDRPDKLQRFQDILVASAAIPGFYKPVYITPSIGNKGPRQMHVDGGLKLPVPVTPAMLHDRTPSEIYFIVNGYLEKPPEEKIVKPNLANIGSRSLNEITWSQFEFAYENLKQDAKRYRNHLTVVAIPKSVKNVPSLADFDVSKMNELFSLGVTEGEKFTSEPQIQTVSTR